jgi:hypothetical protein
VDRDAAWFDLTAKVENPGRVCGAAPAARRLWTVVTYDGVSPACVTATAAGEGVVDLRLVRPTGTTVCLVSRELVLPVPGLEAPDASLFFLNETGAYWLQHTVY